MATKSKGVSCYDKAGDDEPLFVIRAQDILGPETVMNWAHAALSAGVSIEKVAEAREVAREMEEWQLNHSKKVPD